MDSQLYTNQQSFGTTDVGDRAVLTQGYFRECTFNLLTPDASTQSQPQAIDNQEKSTLIPESVIAPHPPHGTTISLPSERSSQSSSCRPEQLPALSPKPGLYEYPPNSFRASQNEDHVKVPSGVRILLEEWYHGRSKDGNAVFHGDDKRQWLASAASQMAKALSRRDNTVIYFGIPKQQVTDCQQLVQIFNGTLLRGLGGNADTNQRTSEILSKMTEGSQRLVIFLFGIEFLPESETETGGFFRAFLDQLLSSPSCRVFVSSGSRMLLEIDNMYWNNISNLIPKATMSI